MDDHASWYVHRRHPFGSRWARFQPTGHAKPIRVRHLGHTRQRAGLKSLRGRQTGETTHIRASRQGWKGRVLASIPSWPTTRAHATQTPPRLRAPAPMDPESERGTGRLTGPCARLRGADGGERPCSPPTWTSTLLSNR